MASTTTPTKPSSNSVAKTQRLTFLEDIVSNTKVVDRASIPKIPKTEHTLDPHKHFIRVKHLDSSSLGIPPPSFSLARCRSPIDSTDTTNNIKRKRVINNTSPCKLPRHMSLFGSLIHSPLLLFRHNNLSSDDEEDPSDDEVTLTGIPFLNTPDLSRRNSENNSKLEPSETSSRKIKRAYSQKLIISKSTIAPKKCKSSFDKQHIINRNNSSGSNGFFNSESNGTIAQDNPEHSDASSDHNESEFDNKTVCTSLKHDNGKENDSSVSLGNTITCCDPHVESPKDNHSLPCTSSSADSIMRVEPSTVRDLLSGKYNGIYDKHLIVDCRFPYEYEGGHIAGATNAPTIEVLEKLLLEQPIKEKRLAIIFHCEYSIKRAPSMASYLRRRDREANIHQYPYLHYPDIYILKGGYCNFYNNHQTMCEPQKYVEMNDKAYEIDCQNHMKQFDRQFRRTKSMNDAKVTDCSVSPFGGMLSNSRVLFTNSVSLTSTLDSYNTGPISPPIACKLSRTNSICSSITPVKSLNDKV